MTFYQFKYDIIHKNVVHSINTSNNNNTTKHKNVFILSDPILVLMLSIFQQAAIQ